MVILCPRAQWAQWLHRLPGNRHRSRPVPRRQCGTPAHRTPVHGNQRIRPLRSAAQRTAWWMRTQRWSITAKTIADVGAKVTTHSPPRRAPLHPRRPAPAKGVVPVPHSALVRQIAPRIPRCPYVAIPRRIHPVPVPIGVPPRARRLIRRPDVALPRHVVPVPARIQVVPRRVAVVAVVLRRPGLGRGLRRQHLVPVRVPRIPRIRLDRFCQRVAARIAANQRHTLPAVQVNRHRAAAFQVRVP